jgi:uncharacterized protein
MYLRRKIYDKLLKWKQTSNGKTALLIEGARRIGKSYVINRFANKEYKSHIIIDFANAEKDVLSVFENDSTDLDSFFNKLSFFYKVRLVPRDSLIVFDEVQLFPRARQLIKYFVKDGRYDFIETGSLLSLKQNVQDILLPSEEECLKMYPMDFEEFLWAQGDETTVPYINEHFALLESIGAAAHRRIMNDFRQYMLVGGMPQSVLEYIQKKDFSAVDTIKKRILLLYRNDVSKFAKGYESKVVSIFDEIPSQLSRHEKHFMLSSISKQAKFRNYEDSFIWLSEAMIVNNCFNATDPTMALSMNTDRLTLKCYMGDTGLLVTHSFSGVSAMDNQLYKSILFDKLNLNEGMLMENIVAQMLCAGGHDLYFYSRPGDHDNSTRMEIDFLIARNGKICPIEVKASDYRRHMSLDRFCKKFSKTTGTPYILYTKDVSVQNIPNGKLICLPLYMAMFL